MGIIDFMAKNELINDIKVAFKDEEYPGDLQLVYDNTEYHLECMEIKKAFNGKFWYNLSENFLYEERESLFFFSKKGFKYYLPAFMIVAVEKSKEMDTLPDTIIHKLTLPAEIDTLLLANIIKRTSLDKQFSQIDFLQILQNQLQQNNKRIHNFIEYMAEFNEKQSIVIRQFLEYMSQYTNDLIYDPQIAIDRYWFQFYKH